MVKKKSVKKADATCGTGNGTGFCGGIMAILIIVLVWISTATWSKVVITIVALLILLGSGSCACRKSPAKKKN